MVMSQWQWLSSTLLMPVFFGAEEQGQAPFGRRQLAAQPIAGFGEGVERLLLAARTYRRCPDDQGAIGDGFGDGSVFAGRFEHGGGIDCRFRPFKGDPVLIHKTKIAEAEVIHCPGDRSDVVGVAGADEDDTEPVEFVFGEIWAEHPWFILGWRILLPDVRLEVSHPPLCDCGGRFDPLR